MSVGLSLGIWWRRAVFIARRQRVLRTAKEIVRRLTVVAQAEPTQKKAESESASSQLLFHRRQIGGGSCFPSVHRRAIGTIVLIDLRSEMRAVLLFLSLPIEVELGE